MSSDTPTPATDIDTIVQEQSSPVTALSKVTDSNRSLGEMGRQAMDSVESLPGTVSSFFDENRRFLTLLGALLVVVVLIAIANGILNVINLIPLVSPALELVGLGYTGWFVWRYLLYADRRQELAVDFEKLKARVTGQLEES